MIFSLDSVAPVAEYILGGVLILMSVLLVAMILFQSAKDKRLSGSIAGGAETFFGKTKGTSMDKVLSKLTIVASAITAVVAIVLVIITNL
ncbi:MAG: preprotein translocase subunit SecG [Clostridia bacterium]|nr:preprotein translocase subunit SecG [Clostridia bacterium]